MKEKLRQSFPEIDCIVMGAGHSNIAGHLPMGKIPLAEVCKKQVLEQRDNASLGLFDNSSPNYTTYYPDVTKEDLNPSEDSFINPVFRALSAVTVHKKYNPIEFPEDVLKESMNMLIGQTINIDHETALGNAIGSIVEVEWQESYKTKSKITVPAGINIRMKIDGKSNPRIARGILMDPPSIHSNSVTVRFTWKPSHEFEDTSEFWNRLGTFTEEGELVRRIATKIVMYAETSLVNHGADPFAKLIGADGKIVNPEMANAFYSLKRDDSDDKEILQSKYFLLDYKDNLVDGAMDEIKNSIKDDERLLTTLKDIKGKQTNTNQMKEKLIKLCLIMGITAEATLTEDNFVEEVEKQFKKLKDDNSSAGATLQTKVDALTTEVGELKSKNAELTADAATGSTALKTAQDEALAAYNLTKGDKADPEMVKVISASSFTAAQAFKKQYQTESDEKFHLTCQDCKSTNVSRATAKAEQEDEDGKNKNTVTNKSNDEVSKSLLAKKTSVTASFIEETKK